VAGTDAIFSNTTGPINIIMAKDAANLGLKVPLIFNDPADCPQIAAAYQPTYCEIPQAMLYPNVANATIKANDGALLSVFQASGGKMLNFPSITVGAVDYVGAQAEYKFQPGHTFGATNPYVLASTENNTDTVVYQPAGAAS
jgi:hypothetical protein